MWIGTTTVSRFRRRASSGDSPQTIFFRRLRPRLLGHKVGHFDIEFGPKRTRARRARDTTMGIASRCRRCCAAVETVGDAFLRSVGPCYVLLGFGLVFTVAYSLLCVVLPLTRDLRTWQGFGTFAAVAFVFGNIRVQLRDVRAHGPGVAHAAGRAGDVRGGGRGGPAVVRQVPVPETRPDAPLLRLQACVRARTTTARGSTTASGTGTTAILQLPVLAVVRVHGHGVAHAGGRARRARDQRLRNGARRRSRKRGGRRFRDAESSSSSSGRTRRRGVGSRVTGEWRPPPRARAARRARE